MTTPADERHDALARYLAGEADPSESASIRQEIAQDPETARLFSLLEGSLRRITDSGDVDVERGLRTVRAGMANDSGVLSMDTARARRAASWTSPFFRAAAAVLIVAGSVVIWRMMTRSATTSAPGVPYVTAVGQTRDVLLSDGTAVQLAPASRLVVSGDYGRTRQVHLEGLAQFKVRHDASHPFVVLAGNASVEDMGTVFTVRTGAAGDVGVVVTAGSVKLRGTRIASDPGVTLHPGDRGIVAQGEASSQPGTATVADLAWTHGGLAFEDATMDRVRSDLRRWYGVEVVVGDSALAARHLTATFDNEPFDQVLRIMGLALDAQVVRRGDTVVMAPRR